MTDPASQHPRERSGPLQPLR